ncbi:hypothetical protein EVAR_13199_1 [Eumeta japonica]|uniref:Uncharacterized protein n=1 Tax=Eumeta variegata TaxID=151549 RepID=A0A4C1TSD4_EUMVA|nr:hypothetical protein EVAR_13199_1 [Eumeta japonica]
MDTGDLGMANRVMSHPSYDPYRLKPHGVLLVALCWDFGYACRFISYVSGVKSFCLTLMTKEGRVAIRADHLLSANGQPPKVMGQGGEGAGGAYTHLSFTQYVGGGFQAENYLRDFVPSLSSATYFYHRRFAPPSRTPRYRSSFP